MLYKPVSADVHDASSPKGPSHMKEPQLYGDSNMGI